LGLLARYGADFVEAFDDEDINMTQFLELYSFYLGQDDLDIKARALQALGFMFIARPEFMMVKDMDKMLESTLNVAADVRIKIQMLRNFTDYLSDVEEKMGVTDGGNEKTHGDNAVPVAAGAGDSNICGGIIQLHWDLILERCLDLNEEVRQVGLKVVEIVLRQGLVHPMTCVPQLIALEVDQLEVNWKLAHRLLLHMNEKYPSFFESRLGDGLLLSYAFIQSKAVSRGQKDELSSPASFAKPGISRIYKLIRSSRNSRNKFLSSVIRKFDFGASGVQSVPFLVYCSEVLSVLPFGIPDEPLYVVYTINRVVQVRAGELEANMKAIISGGATGGAVVKQDVESNATTDEVALGPLSTMLDTNKEVAIDMADLGGLAQDALDKLKDYCNSAMALALLLRLKRHMKIVYGLNDARCQAYQPTEVIKPGDMLTRREGMKEFNLKGLPLESSTTTQQMVEQYKVFKRLLKEDTLDYAAYTANISTKKRPARVSTDNHDNAPHVNGGGQSVVARAQPRRKSVTQATVENDDSDADDSGEDWGASKSGTKNHHSASKATRKK
jgi:cohesin loading factor subunit SCC2